MTIRQSPLFGVPYRWEMGRRRDEPISQDDEGIEWRREALESAIRWAWTVKMQAGRLREIEDQLEAEVMRALQIKRKANFTPEDREPYLQLRAETHFLLNAADKLMRALPIVGVKIPKKLAADVNLLRDFHEHPERQQRGPRQTPYEKFKSQYPETEPTEHRFGRQGTFVGGVSISELVVPAETIYQELLRLEGTNFVWRGWEFR